MASILDAPEHERNMTPGEPRFGPSRWTRPDVQFRRPAQDDRATPEWDWHLVACAQPLDTAGFAGVLRQIGDLASGDETDEYGVLRPTPHALNTTIIVLLGSLPHVNVFPRGCVTTDEQGGLRIEWSDNDRAVHLVVPATDGGPSYIYHELGDTYGTERSVTANVLARWLRILFG